MAFVNKVQTDIPIVQSTASANVSTNSTLENVNVKDSSAKQELLQRLQITEKQLESILLKSSDFYSLPVEKQTEIVATIKAQAVETTPVINKSDETFSDTNTSSTTTAPSADELTATLRFDHKSYAELSTEQKFAVYAEELAKNKFIYADPKNPKDWNSLTDAQKQELIKAQSDALTSRNGKNVFSGDDVDKMLQYGMTKVQAANYLGVTLDELQSKEPDAVIKAVHNYVVALGDKRTEGQQIYLREQEFASNALLDYAKKHNYEIDVTTMTPDKIKKHCEALGVNIYKVEKKYLENKKDQGALSDEDNKRLEALTELDGLVTAVQDKLKDGPVNYGRLAKFEETDFGELYNSATTHEEKAVYIIKYLESQDADVNFKTEFISELVQKDEKLGALLYNEFIGSSSKEDKLKIAQSKIGYMPEMNSWGVNEFDEASTQALAQTQKEIHKTDSKRAQRIAMMSQNNADGEHLVHLSAVHAGFGDVEVERNLADRALNHDIVDIKQQQEILTNTFNMSSSEARIFAGTNIDRAYKENQLPLHNQAIKDKVVNDAMANDGTYSRYAKENQTAALSAQKQRFEQDDYSKEDAIAGLNKLSDFIPDCDKDNQLAMHKEMMTSKYSEVQEHVAGNIKNYDPSVQNDAMNVVYQSGNEKAIEIAVSNISGFKSPDVQQVALKQATMELADDEFQTKFANGTLSQAEILQLSSSERRDYYINLFDKATATEKIKYLKELPAGRAKQTVYNLIGTYYKNLFVQMVSDDVQTAESMFNMGLKTQLHGIVKNCIITKAETNPSYKFLRDRLGLSANEEESLQIARTSNYSSVSNNFEKDNFVLFPKDRHGNLLA